MHSPGAPTPGASIFIFEVKPAPSEGRFVELEYRGGHPTLGQAHTFLRLFADHGYCYSSFRRTYPDASFALNSVATTKTVDPILIDFLANRVRRDLEESHEHDLKIHGYADPDEGSSLEEARSLAERRAIVVRAWLQGQGLAVGQMHIVAHDWTETARTSDDSSVLNQRAEVIVGDQKASMGVFRRASGLTPEILERVASFVRNADPSLPERCTFESHAPSFVFRLVELKQRHEVVRCPESVEEAERVTLSGMLLDAADNGCQFHP